MMGNTSRHSFALQCECGASRSQGVGVVFRPQHSRIPILKTRLPIIPDRSKFPQYTPYRGMGPQRGTGFPTRG